MYFRLLAVGLALLCWAKTVHALLCRDISIPVSINALNKLFPATLDMGTVTAEFLQKVPDLPNVAFTGDFVIAATFCEPSVINPSRRKTL